MKNGIKKNYYLFLKSISRIQPTFRIVKKDGNLFLCQTIDCLFKNYGFTNLNVLKKLDGGQTYTPILYERSQKSNRLFHRQDFIT